MTTCSLIISTYNWPEALSLSLQGVLKQTTLPDEVIIADDGSTPDTKEIIQTYQQDFPVPLLHVWHEDQGFQLAKIRNKAIARASGAYIIQIDGDIIVHPKFIEDHLRVRKNGFFVIGSRGLLTPAYSELILLKQKLPDPAVLRRNSSSKFNMLRNKWLSEFLSSRYKVNGKYKYYAKGCNMAFWRADAITVNGYNEAIVGWGPEDIELISRFFILGLKKQFLKLGGVAYHIWHKTASKKNKHIHDEILLSTQQSGNYRCQTGIDQYL